VADASVAAQHVRGPEVLEWAEAPEPHAGPGQIRIAVRAASVNPIDWKQFSGAMAGGEPMAGIGYLGADAAGVVDEVGEGVTGVSVGDEVFGRGQHTQAEYAVLDAWAAKASSVDWAVAAAAGVAGETAERGLRLLEVKAGDTLFVDGGAGGVGAVAVQMALARGATVIASASQANTTTCASSARPRCYMARAWPSGSGPRPADRSTRSSTSPARPRSRS
jgi:NADPH:quinone reductase-like Zn-dependent oxidoreductase